LATSNLDDLALKGRGLARWRGLSQCRWYFAIDERLCAKGDGEQTDEHYESTN
jgi:hypothetical protein